MIKTPLQEIIKDCTSKNMSCLEIQFTLCKLTCYLSEGLEVKGPSLEKEKVNNVNEDELAILRLK